MQNRKHRVGWRSLCLALVLVGIFFRFTHLDQKVYWHDEVYTSLEVSAHSHSELLSEVFVGREVGVTELQTYQRINTERGFGDMIYWLAKEDSQHPPLYLTLLRGWLQVLGDSVAITRSLSAVISLLCIPCFYWLCLELFESSLSGWIAIALMSISPFHVLYAQEAREYSLLTLTTLLTSLMLLRAMRLQTRQSWMLYTLSLIVALYSSLLSILIAIGQGFYVLVRSTVRSPDTKQFQVDQGAIAYLTSFLYAVLAFSPWLYIVAINVNKVETGVAWANQPLPGSVLAQLWVLNLTQGLIDFNPYIDDLPAYLPLIPILGLEIFSVYFLCRRTSKKVWLLVIMLISVIAVPLALADLFLGGQRSVASRYLVPMHLGLELPVVYFLACQIQQPMLFTRTLWKGVLTILITVGIFSCLLSSQAEVWWNKSSSNFNPQVARLLNASDRPALISDSYDSNPGNVISLSYLVDQKVKFILLPEIREPVAVPGNIPKGTDMFFLNLPEVFLRKISAVYRIPLVPIADKFWRSKETGG
jgi:uncharacterized membrane protein